MMCLKCLEGVPHLWHDNGQRVEETTVANQPFHPTQVISEETLSKPVAEMTDAEVNVLRALLRHPKWGPYVLDWIDDINRHKKQAEEATNG